jgi:hypothetical protein
LRADLLLASTAAGRKENTMGRTVHGELGAVTVLDQEETVNLVNKQGEQIHVCALTVSEVGGRQEWNPPQDASASALLTEDDVVFLVQHLLHWAMGAETALQIVRDFLTEAQRPVEPRDARP